MQLAKFTDYALRVLMHLSVAKDHSMSTRQIAQIHDARFNHLAKVTQWLAREGYVTATRGRSGGLRLALPPQDINVGRIVRALEQDDGLVECLSPGGGACAISPICGLTPALRKAQDAFFEVLDQYTMGDIVQRRGQMEALLTRLNAAVDG